MAFDWATTGPYSGGTVTFIEEYRGYKIYFLAHWGLQFYGLVDPAGVELNRFHTDLSNQRNYIDTVLGPPDEPEPEPPLEPEPDPWATEYYSTYRDVVIEQYVVSKSFTFILADMVWAYVTIEECHNKIDSILGPITPPEPDPTAKTLDSTYRDIKIYQFTVSKWFIFTYEGEEYTRQYRPAILYEIDQLLGPTFKADVFVTMWGPYSIWKSGSTSLHYVIVDAVPQGEFETVEQAKDYIEDVLGYEPDAPVITPGDEPDYTPMNKDPSRAALISGPVNTFLASVGLTPEALDAVTGSGADPAKAAAYAKSVSMASVGAVAILGTIGVVAEVASLGQVETVAATIDMVLEKTGIAGLLDELFRLPFMSALVTPARHHWNSVYTPELSGLSQITRELVREVISLDTYLEEAAMQGLSNERAMRVWDSHWRELGIRDTDTIFHRGDMNEDEWEKYRVIQDYRPTARPGFRFSDLDMSKALRKTILGRVDTRRAYQYGYMDRTKLIELYTYQGYEEDAVLQADIQIRASVDGLQSAIRREEGMMYRDRLKDAREDESAAVGAILADRNTKLVDLGNATIAGEYTEEEAAVIEADIRNEAETMIAEVRAKARAREEEVEKLYRTALEEVKELIDPEDLWVLRYKLAADRVEVAEEFEITPPVEVVETPEEPE